ncbi:protein of unassigned function [Methylobacterium oryzae CBMB20]|uniref:Protein of unassigned function n=1 Tax=Methylobacterium oryzae CBMB20 TaxID=693986 RepID=A0A089P0E0_9HYPH|nr:protein of unassigned function [Methylobacterium oryzae CBMB20]
MSNGGLSGFGWRGRLDPGTARLSPEPAVDSLPRSQVVLRVASDQEVERSVR